jgi:hypothetical protein
MRQPARNNNNLLAAELKSEKDAGREDCSVIFLEFYFSWRDPFGNNNRDFFR